MPLSEFLSQNSVFVTVDSAPTSTSTSDYNAVVVMAITPYNELFILDVFNRRVKEHITALQALRFADKWRASVIGVELHSKSQGVYGALQHMLGTRAESVEEFDHLPSLRPLRVGYAAKTARISSMQYRFGDPNVTDPTQHGYGGLIKYPLNSPIIRNREWQDLVTQTEQFSPDAADGGLENDDVLDCLGRDSLILTGRGEVPIHQVTTSDVVLTRQGWKRVLRAWSKGHRECIFRNGLWATPDHRVWTENRGWIPHTEIGSHDTILKCHFETPSSLTEHTFTDTPSPSVVTCGSTTGRTLQPKNPPSPSIEPFGSSTTGPFRTAGMSTTSTRIPSTTRSQTFKLSRANNTSTNTPSSIDCGVGATSNSNCLNPCGNAANENPSNVRAVLASSSPSRTDTPSTALRAANFKPEKTSQGVEPKGVQILPTLDCLRINAVLSSRGNDAVPPRTMEVWDLTVEDCPEFFANGVLVHNCVSMHQDVVVGLRKKPSVRAAAPSVIQQLKDGKRFDDHTPLAFRVNWAEISREDMDQIIEAGRRLRDKPKPNESQA